MTGNADLAHADDDGFSGSSPSRYHRVALHPYSSNQNPYTTQCTLGPLPRVDLHGTDGDLGSKRMDALRGRRALQERAQTTPNPNS